MITPCKDKDKRDSKDKYCLYSKDGDKLLGRGETKEDMEKREKQVQYFKHKGVKLIADSILKRSAGIPTKIEIGKTYEDINGNRVTIKDIYISGFHLPNSRAFLTYDYTTKEGKTGTENNDVASFKKFWDLKNK